MALRPPSDERLIARTREGDPRAFATLHDRYAPQLLSFCRYVLGNREDAQDALQQTFIRAHRTLTDGDPPAEFKPWIYAVARNRCRTLMAERAKRPLPAQDFELGATDGLDAQVQRREDLRALVRDVDGLPEDQRAALVLFELGDLSQREVAGVIGVPEQKVKALIHQARTNLVAEREARERSCSEVREELAVARGGALRRGPLKRHLKACPACTAWRAEVAGQRAALGAILPVGLVAGSRDAVLPAVGLGGAGAGAGIAGVASTGATGVLAKGAVTKAVAALALVGGGTAGTVAVVEHDTQRPTRSTQEAPASPAAAAATTAAPPAVVPVARTTSTPTVMRSTTPGRRVGARKHARKRGARPAGLPKTATAPIAPTSTQPASTVAASTPAAKPLAKAKVKRAVAKVRKTVRAEQRAVAKAKTKPAKAAPVKASKPANAAPQSSSKGGQDNGQGQPQKKKSTTGQPSADATGGTP